MRWAEIPETDGDYWVSDEGQVWSRPRRGTSGGLLTPYWDSEGYLRVSLYTGERRIGKVHRLMLEAFVGPDDGRQCRHLDGDRANNRLENLVWGTPSENMKDRVRHGNDQQASQSECIHGHPFDEENTYVRSNGWRVCRTCQCERMRQRRMKGVV